MIKHAYLLIVFPILFVFSIVLIATVHATSPKTKQSARISACSPDRPVVYPKESVNFRVWTKPMPGDELSYNWHTDAGTIKGQGNVVDWNFTGLSEGVYKASVTIKNKTKNIATCHLTVRVGLPPLNLMSGGYETGSAILLPEQGEDNIYGLYSYLVFGAKPDKSNKDSYLQAVIEFLKFPDVKDLHLNGFKYKELNVTYLPLIKPLDRKLVRYLKERDFEKYPEIAEWILKYYNYAKARKFLHSFKENYRSGPYIISSLKPVGDQASSQSYLFIDMSTATPNVVGFWMRYYQDQAAQEQYWNEDSVKLIVLKLRTTMAVAADGLPVVTDALDKLIKWVEGVS